MGILRRLFGRKYTPSWDKPTEPEILSEDGAQAEPGFYTGTATVAIFDLESLKHRLDDEVDWWADPQAEIVEVNQRNVLICGLGSDGFYDVEVIDGDGIGLAYSLRFPSGRVFIGPGEALTGGGDEPDERSGGMFLDLMPGDYKVGIDRANERLRISLLSFAAFPNAVTESIMI